MKKGLSGAVFYSEKILTFSEMRANMSIEKGTTDRRLARILYVSKVTAQFNGRGRLFLCLVSISAECVSGTKAGDAETHDCNEIQNTHWLSPPFR